METTVAVFILLKNENDRDLRFWTDEMNVAEEDGRRITVKQLPHILSSSEQSVGKGEEGFPSRRKTKHPDG